MSGDITAHYRLAAILLLNITKKKKKGASCQSIDRFLLPKKTTFMPLFWSSYSRGEMGEPQSGANFVQKEKIDGCRTHFPPLKISFFFFLEFYQRGKKEGEDLSCKRQQVLRREIEKEKIGFSKEYYRGQRRREEEKLHSYHS